MSESAPAGWYPDRSGELRYWDGTAWTQHTAPDPVRPPQPVTETVYATGNGNTYAAASYQAGYPGTGTNGVGTAGFVLALIALLGSWIPFVGWVVWFLGLVLSFIGVFKQPRGLAVAGLVISLIGVIILILFATVLAGLLFAFA